MFSRAPLWLSTGLTALVVPNTCTCILDIQLRKRRYRPRRRRMTFELRQLSLYRGLCPPVKYDHYSNYTLLYFQIYYYTPLRLPTCWEDLWSMVSCQRAGLKQHISIIIVYLVFIGLSLFVNHGFVHNNKKLNYCWETVRRESMPRIA